MRLSQDDRRRSQRKWMAMPVTLRTNGARIAGVTLNVSEHGMYVFAAANLAMGDSVGLEFQSPDGDELVQTEGIVRRKAVYLYAIELRGTNSPDADSIPRAHGHSADPLPEYRRG